MEYFVELTERKFYSVIVPEGTDRPSDKAEEMARDGEGHLLWTEKEWTYCEPMQEKLNAKLET